MGRKDEGRRERKGDLLPRPSLSLSFPAPKKPAAFLCQELPVMMLYLGLRVNRASDHGLKFWNHEPK